MYSEKNNICGIFNKHWQNMPAITGLQSLLFCWLYLFTGLCLVILQYYRCSLFCHYIRKQFILVLLVVSVSDFMNVGFMRNISRYWSRITSSSRKAHYTGSYFFKYTLWYTVFVLYTETLIDTHFSLFPWEMVFYVLFHSFLSLSNVVFIRNSLHKFNTEIVKAVSCLFVFILFFYLFIFYLFFFLQATRARIGLELISVGRIRLFLFSSESAQL